MFLKRAQIFTIQAPRELEGDTSEVWVLDQSMLYHYAEMQLV